MFVFFLLSKKSEITSEYMRKNLKYCLQKQNSEYNKEYRKENLNWR